MVTKRVIVISEYTSLDYNMFVAKTVQIH